MQIEANQLTHVYTQNGPVRAAAIEDISFSMERGEFVGIIGHTGSGKSTLAQHLNGLLRPTSGSLCVDGIDIPKKGGDMRAVRRKVGMVFQYPEYQLFDETVEKDIAFGPKNLGIEGDELRACVHGAMQDMGLDIEQLAHRSPFELSGGQKRRVAIAGVLAMQPEVLVLDEPMAGLDPAGRDDMIALMRLYNGERGRSVVMISHSMDDVAALCSRVLVMQEGHLRMDAPPGEVFEHGDQLRAMGLSQPAATQIANQLRAKGFAIARGTITMAALHQEILKEMGGAPHGDH